MEIKIESKHFLWVLQALSWIIFIGLCIAAGGLLFNSVYALCKPVVAKNFWNGIDLSELYAFDKGYFMTQTSLVTIAATMKALIFYQIVSLFHDKKFSLSQPFNAAITSLVFKIAYCCLGAALFSFWGARFAARIKKQGVPMPDAELLRIGGADVWLLMAVTLLVIGYVFKRGTELQTENDLTI
jgi:hypothetical protein